MNKAYHAQGWTLVELMITVGILGVLAGIAIPGYHSYIFTSQIGTARANAEQLALFQEAYFYDNNGVYKTGVFDPSAGTDQLTIPLAWQPSGDRNTFKYEVTTPGTCPTGVAQCYTITVTQIGDPSVVASITRP